MTEQTIAELFERSVTREIAPVVYFHETTPQNIQGEVDEYIVTGGYEENDPRRKRVERGIHEEYVRLLTQITRQVKDFSGAEPASWISGFYGSGKSSFAKMLGLALDNPTLPDGRHYAEAWLARDQTPRRQELVDAWTALQSEIDSMAVIFDIGGSAREEPIHITILREALKRFGYATNPRVAAFELIMEADSYYEVFAKSYEDLNSEQWEVGKTKKGSDSAVSAVLHKMFPERYDSPTAWRLIHGREQPFSMSPNEVRDWLDHMLKHRAPGKTLFLVVDEISQYVIGQNQRMLDLQSFNSALGHLRGRVWLLATGQQKLEEQDSTSELGKMKGRFPVNLRVHLGEQNIREVVHKRLLKKTHAGEEKLRAIFQKNQTNLKLYAYGCESITEEDFVEVYPMLPAHINLLLDITTQIRHRSKRIQGDSHSVRGLMQLLGDLFRDKELASRPVGSLICFDDIYDVQATSLDVDTQSSMEKVKNWAATQDDDFALSVAKVVALLQLVQEDQPTTTKFVAQCLYNQVDRGPKLEEDVAAALNRLKNASNPLVSYSERTGWRLESSSRAEWNQERDTISIPTEMLFEAVKDRLTSSILETPSKPFLKGVPLPYAAWFSDSRGHNDVVLKSARGAANAPLDIRLLAQHERAANIWITRSDESSFQNRLIWVAGEVENVYDVARRWARSRQMVKRYEARRESLSLEKQQILLQEKADEELLGRALEDALRSALMEGTIYFRGRTIEPRQMGDGFGTALEHSAASVLEDLYPHYSTLTVSESELKQLFNDSLHGVSKKFMVNDGFGLLDIEHGEYVVKCSGAIPQQILREIRESNGVGGAYLFDCFGTMPYGYHPSLIKACLLGLLRGNEIRITPRGGVPISFYGDPGTQDLFSGERELRTAEFFVNDGPGYPERSTITRVARELETAFNLDVDREVGPLAEAITRALPPRQTQLKSLRDIAAKLPRGGRIPTVLEDFDAACSGIMANRDPRDVVQAFADSIDTMRNGLQQLGIVRQELTIDVVEKLSELDRILRYQVRQLKEINLASEDVLGAADRITAHFDLERPWKGAEGFEVELELIRKAYLEVRQLELTKAGKAIEDARDRIKMRSGFETLTTAQSNEVLRPFALVLPDTDAQAIEPTLAVIRARNAVLHEAVEEAHAILDEILGPKVVIVQARVRGRVIKSQEELDALIHELRNSVSEQLNAGKEVRLV